MNIFERIKNLWHISGVEDPRTVQTILHGDEEKHMAKIVDMEKPLDIFEDPEL